jgi:hypothetical protein
MSGAKLDEILPPATNFTLTTAERLRGMEGLPRFLIRKREIEELRDIDRKTGGSLELGRPWRPFDFVSFASLRAELDGGAR